MRKTGSVQDKLDSAVDTVISRATKLVNAGVFPVLVFDGARTTRERGGDAREASRRDRGKIRMMLFASDIE